LDSKITYESFIEAFNNRFGEKIISLGDALQTLSQNYTIYAVSFESITLLESTVNGPRIGLCAPDINVTSTKLNAAQMGCMNDGLGQGNGNGSCPGSGGAHGGKGGYGSAGLPEKAC
jgi:hypothetical protein